jgi:hypothetical protein
MNDLSGNRTGTSKRRENSLHEVASLGVIGDAAQREDMPHQRAGAGQ